MPKVQRGPLLVFLLIIGGSISAVVILAWIAPGPEPNVDMRHHVVRWRVAVVEPREGAALVELVLDVLWNDGLAEVTTTTAEVVYYRYPDSTCSQGYPVMWEIRYRLEDGSSYENIVGGGEYTCADKSYSMTLSWPGKAEAISFGLSWNRGSPMYRIVTAEQE